MARPKFHYGEIYDIAPTLGIDLPFRGKIEITGIIRFDEIPSEFHADIWITGEAEFDHMTMFEPWYFFKYLDDEEGETICLPEFALDEVFHKAHKEKIEKWRNNRLMENQG
jgi:hypothetical protein